MPLLDPVTNLQVTLRAFASHRCLPSFDECQTSSYSRSTLSRHLARPIQRSAVRVSVCLCGPLVHRCFVWIDHRGYTVRETKMFLGFYCSISANRLSSIVETRFDLIEMHGGFDQVSPNEQHQGKHMVHWVSLVVSGRLRQENPLPLVSPVVPDGTCATRLSSYRLKPYRQIQIVTGCVLLVLFPLQTKV